MKRNKLSQNQVQRYPLYLDYLRSINFDDNTYISNREFANVLKLNIEVVKKDLAAISSEKGLPRIGRKVSVLINDLMKIVGVKEELNAVLIGAGHLGKALLNFDDFKKNGLNIVTAFDVNPLLYEVDINGINVYPLKELKDYVDKNNISVAILTVPNNHAQEVVDILNQTKIEAIWNFATIAINVNSNIVVSNMSMASSYANLYHQLILKRKERLKNGRN